MPKSASSLVDEAVAGEKLPPQHRDGDAGAEQRRQIEHRAVERQAARCRCRASSPRRARSASFSGTASEHIDEGHRHRRRRISDRRWRCGRSSRRRSSAVAQQVVVGEGQIERDQGRPERQAEEADEPGQEKQIAVEARARNRPRAAFCAGAGCSIARVIAIATSCSRGAFARAARRMPAGGVRSASRARAWRSPPRRTAWRPRHPRGGRSRPAR